MPISLALPFEHPSTSISQPERESLSTRAAAEAGITELSISVFSATRIVHIQTLGSTISEMGHDELSESDSVDLGMHESGSSDSTYVVFVFKKIIRI